MGIPNKLPAASGRVSAHVLLSTSENDELVIACAVYQNVVDSVHVLDKTPPHLNHWLLVLKVISATQLLNVVSLVNSFFVV